MTIFNSSVVSQPWAANSKEEIRRNFLIDSSTLFLTSYDFNSSFNPVF